METRIAIPRSLRSLEAGLSANATTSQKRKNLLENALGDSPHSHALADSGLEEVKLREQVLDVEKALESKNSFSRLGRLGAYIIHADKEKLVASSEIFEENSYHLVPDLKLSLPSSKATKGLGASSRVSPWGEVSGVQDAHDAGVKGGEVIVGILDTGCDCDHVQFMEREKPIQFRYFPPNSPELPRKMRGFDPAGHGTHVTGIVAGKSIGVSPEADLLVASVIESESVTTSLLRVISALEWILSEAIAPGNEEKAVIVNLSLGFKPKDVSKALNRVYSEAMRDLFTSLLDDFDVLPIVAIGNEGAGTFRYPGVFPEALAVGAVNNKHEPWSQSGGGSAEFDSQRRTVPDIAGYGVKIYSSYQRTIEGHSKYAKISGTSMAAPYVSGIAALMAQEHGLKGRLLRQKLIETALPLEFPNERVGVGVARFLPN